MESSELSKLIPLYVAGSLSEPERQAVEEALVASAELRTELAFWKQAQYVTSSYDPNHPSAEAIVKYAEGKLIGADRLAFEAHLNQCADCRQELEVIRETYPAEESTIEERAYTGEVSVLELFKEFFRTIRTVYPLPAAVLGALCVFLAATLFFIRKEPASVVVSQVPRPIDRHISLTLEYSPQLRSAGMAERPKLYLTDDINVIDIFLFIPRSIDSVQYTLSLISPSKTTTQIQDLVRPSRYNESLDRLTAAVKRSYFKVGGEYHIIATEQLSSAAGITPESHDYPFVVSIASPK